MLRIKTAVNAGLTVLYFLSACFLNEKKSLGLKIVEFYSDNQKTME